MEDILADFGRVSPNKSEENVKKVLTVIERIRADLIRTNNAIDGIKFNYETLSKSRAAYLDAKDKPRIPFIYKKRLLQSKKEYVDTFNKIFSEFYCCTDKIFQDLSEMLSTGIFKTEKFSDSYLCLDNLRIRFASFPDDINSDYFAKVVVDDLNTMLTYARNLLHRLSDEVDKINSKASKNNGKKMNGTRAKAAEPEENQGSPNK